LTATPAFNALIVTTSLLLIAPQTFLEVETAFFEEPFELELIPYIVSAARRYAGSA